jgi:aspartate aminotransferase
MTGEHSEVMELAKRIGEIKPSITLAISAMAKAMQKDGKDVCSFSAGEPDFDTPEHIKTMEPLLANLDCGKRSPISCNRITS